MTIVASLLVVLFAFALFATVYGQLEPDPIPVEVPPDPMYAPRHHATGAPLPERPKGRAALKAEIACTTTDLVLADRPSGQSGKRHDPDWQFHTDAWEQVRESWFADQPDDRAVALPWRGSGRVRVVDVTDETYAAVTR